MYFKILVALSLPFFAFAQNATKNNYTKYVNPFIGTNGTGHCFPGPCMPFGMVQPGPDNRNSGWDYTSGYQYSDTTIMGFSQTRANGTGISEFGDVLLLPLTANTKNKTNIGYIKSSEKAFPGYYTVKLNNGIQVALTSTNRVAFHQYQFPENEANLLVDLQHGLAFLTDSLVLESNVRVENNHTISGYCHTKNWVERKYFFNISFNTDFYANQLLPPITKANAPRYLLSFNLKNKQLLTKISLSTVSVAGAKNNMQTELPDWNFKAVVTKCNRKWNKYLSTIQIDAPQKQKEIFYTCMYRLFIQPSNIADVDGKYRGANDVVKTAYNKSYYSTLSLWDTYRAAHPLYTLISPEKVAGFINTFIDHSKAAGFLPIWTAWGKDNYCMIGNHAIPIITDAFVKGFKGFDAKAALNEMIKSTSVNHINSNWTLLNKYGYYPFDSLDTEAVSRTLEHGVDDYSVALMAEKMGEKQIAATYYKRSKYYKNIFDVSTAQMRGKNSNGEWRKPFNPLVATSPMNNPGDYTEANAWQYFWTPAQYDIEGLTELLGCKEAFTHQLDSFFAIKALNPNKHLGQEAMIGQYAHGNEPSHHIAYLYAFSTNPQKGNELISAIYNNFYNNTTDGLIGNDDCGQMSAWYIFATLGFYPINAANGTFVLAQPQVANALVKVGNKHLLRINKVHNGAKSSKVYWNKQLLKSPIINFTSLQKGGVLGYYN